MADAWSDQITNDLPPAADVFTKCHSARLDDYRAAEQIGVIPFYREMSSQSAPVVEHDGRPVIMLGSNNYLGLTGDPRVKRAAIEAVERYGTGCTGSRLMNGTLSLHVELEDELTDWMAPRRPWCSPPATWPTWGCCPRWSRPTTPCFWIRPATPA